MPSRRPLQPLVTRIGPDPDDVLARAILGAHADRRCLTAPYQGQILNSDRAYPVQRRVTAARLEGGERRVGWKLGYTSPVMREQMGIAEPNVGPLTDRMLLADGAVVPDTVTQPRVEPEIALVMASDLPGPPGTTGIVRCVASAHAALEIVDSVWTDYRFTWAENTADGSSAAYVVLGPRLDRADLAGLPVDLVVDDVVRGRGVGADAMGGPYLALAWLAEWLADSGDILRAGDVVITGGLAPAIPLEPGARVHATFGNVTVRARGQSPRDGDAVDGSLEQ
jgi:2-keto-4-pentenoate hydratase